MKPHIDATSFGTITIEGELIEHDIVINPEGHIHKRNKSLSKNVYGTSHMISEDEVNHIMEEGATELIIGGGQHGMTKLSQEAKKRIEELGITVHLSNTPEASKFWNDFQGKAVGLFHVTC